MSAESPRHARSGGPLTVPSQPPSDRSIIDAVSGFINDVTLSSSSTVDPKDVIQWARFETADINEPTPEGDSDNDVPPLLLILGYGAGVQVWLIPPAGEAQEVLSWRQGTVRVLRILPTPQHGDCFASKRPLIALCDSASPGPAFCSLSFISIRGGEQVKSIKFKNPILDVLANKRSVVVSFSERFAVFDAATLEDRLAITTCYPCPCPLGGNSPINPLTLGDRWLAYADKKLNPSKRSSGGCESEGVTSYTATVLHAAKSLSKGLRGLGESVAHSLAGGRSTSQSPSPPHADIQQPGVVTVLDIEGNEDEDSQDCEDPCDPIVAHFIAHSEAIIALKFDPSGMLLVTADRRGHDFHVFRINPHPCGPSLAAVHHLYILHRGDTTAKVQDIAISGDSRWAAISTLRGTTHVFAISPYGGACGVRTHTQPRVVNRLSRFHRSAGLPIHGAPCAHSPVCEGMGAGAWFPNPRLPPYPQPNSSTPLAQLRPTHNLATNTITRTSSGRQRLSSVSEENGSVPLLARVCFGVSGITGRAASVPLYLMAASGALLHLALHPRPARSVPKEKICDESPIELEVEAMAQWPLQRPPAAADLLAPLPPSNPLLQPLSCRRCADMCMSEEERWLSQVEIVTHAGPHRRLWMGPQFVFKTYNSTGSNSSLSEVEAVEVDTSAARGAARSNPVNMPGVRPIVPVLIDSGSASSLEHSPSDSFRRKSLLAESGRAPSVCDVQLREDLAEAMKEDHGLREGRSEPRVVSSAGVERAVAPQGTVVAPLRTSQPPPLDPDAYTRSNDDEGAFRPVVRAPAPLAPHLTAQPLPHSTTIPVQSVSPRELSPEEEPLPLNTDVVIPAELTGVRSWLPVADRIDYGTEVFEERTDTYDFHDEKYMLIPERASPPDVAKLDRPNLDVKDIVVNKDLERDSVKRDSVRERVSVAETEREDVSKSLPKLNRAPDDIQPVARPRVKKSPTTKSVSDRAASGISIKSKISTDDCEINLSKREEETPKVKTVADVKKEVVQTAKDEKTQSQKTVKESESVEVKKDFSVIEKNSTVVTEVPKCANKVSTEKQREKEIKTEEQAWDMLLNEPGNSVKSNKELSCSPKDTKIEETKIKSKKNRKTKKSEEQQAKEDDDSFIEIHAIEDKHQILSGDLVSISTPFEEMDTASSYLSKSKKQRSSKSRTPERKDENEIKADNITENPNVTCTGTTKKMNPNESLFSETKSCAHSTSITIETVHDSQNKEPLYSDTINLLDSKPVTSLFAKESPKSVKSKSSSPKLDGRKTGKTSEIEEKEVYVINTTEDDFPEIQITRGNKTHKKSPLLSEKKNHENDKVEKPIKSWSSIAASKNVKKDDDIEPNVETIKKDDTQDAATILEFNKKSEISLQEKLMELCKRTDIMVAECDAPSDLNFVEEHHSVLPDLPPLEPLGFGLDDFKLEVMRDSLLEEDQKITSPICKINIDDILSSIKDTTKKAIESSTFNLIDIEKVPTRKEKGFNVVESDKITSQEVKLDDDTKAEKDDLEKSSDEDIASPALSADSDKDDKKTSEAANANLTSKQSKSKKSRRKKK
ncbi:uncharacterized protein LOC123866036 isoform X2 [Maniola jurtina]|uniref:uncharacterized protein LOC123866036 isoform X2 n=1 Tax=Maniola jurtina TaxID=191418 RepID=UPI001E68E881|nr:uncharacterized protein LOC123866036 isoform X2 [Maniola jurtina]